MQQRFRIKNHKVFSEEANKIALSANNDKIIESIDSIETYTYETSKYYMSNKEIKCSNIIKQNKND